MAAKVFVGKRMGRKNVFILKDNGNIEMLGDCAPNQEAMDYLEHHLPPLSEEEMEIVSKFHIAL